MIFDILLFLYGLLQKSFLLFVYVITHFNHMLFDFIDLILFINLFKFSIT